jgi:uncharacterized protein YdiU (UPF0061 family)
VYTVYAGLSKNDLSADPVAAAAALTGGSSSSSSSSSRSTRSKRYATAYGGHQYGHWVVLGDGRTATIGDAVSQVKCVHLSINSSFSLCMIRFCAVSVQCI